MANVLGTLFGDIADAIRAKSGESGTMKPAEFPAKIAAIPAGGGGSVAGAVTVTFCNYDGTELYSRRVFIGDDCPDPVTQGKISTPTKASTAQYYYTHNGWSTTEGGSASTTALKSITSDTTVYAAYSSTVRKYTVRFYDGDTLMKTEQVAYGSKATPPDTAKAGFTFVNWTPSDLTVYGDTDYIGTWIEAGWAENIPITKNNYEGGSQNYYYKVLFSRDGTRLLVETGQNIVLHDATKEDCPPIYTKTGMANHTYYAKSPTEDVIACGYTSKAVSKRLFIKEIRFTDTDIATNLPYDGKGDWEDGVSRYAYHMAYSPDGNTIYALTTDSKIFAFNTTTWEYTSHSIPYDARRLAVSPDGKTLVCGGSIGYDAPIMYDLENGFSVIADKFPAFGRNVNTNIKIHYSPDGRYVAYTGNRPDDQIAVYDVTTTPATKVASLNFAGFGVTDFEFTHDGSKLVCVLDHSIEQPYDGVRAFDTTTWQELGRPAYQLENINTRTMAINPSDTLLAIGTLREPGIYLFKIMQD